MLIDNKSANARLESKDNLFNRLRQSSPGRAKAMELFGLNRGETNNRPFLPQFGNAKAVNELDEETIAAPLARVETNNDEVKTGEVLDAPSIDDLLENPDKKIKLQEIHDNALDVLNGSIKALKGKINDVQKPEKIADIATRMSKIVSDIRNDKSDKDSDKSVHFHFYTPERKTIADYERVTV